MSVELSWDVEQPPELPDNVLLCAAQAALTHGGRAEAQIEIVILSDESLAQLHGQFLSDDSPTDVMAFELEDEHGGPDGEVYVSLDCARRVARERGMSLERELALYIAHGCLHLCGFDDHSDADRARMRLAESVVLQELGYEQDSAPHEQGP